MSNIIKLGRIKTSRTELIDITKAWIVLSLAFAFVFSGISLLSGGIERLFSMQFLILFLVSVFTAGLGFLLHELGHKFVAQKYGCAAEFRAFDQMLYLALGLAVLVGFIFAAPGAVMISGMITRKENGIISAAGPLVNYVLAMIFLGLVFFFPSWGSVWAIGFNINLILGAFNMLPIMILDGKKIFDWNVPVWFFLMAFGVLGYIYRNSILFFVSNM